MILLTHTDEERDLFYGDEALSRLRALDEVRLNVSGQPLAGADFVKAASGAAIVVGSSKATADVGFFAAVPDLRAYVHGHVDLRRVDVAAASANGILVTRASPGFDAAVTELVVGFMVDLARGISRAVLGWRGGETPATAHGRQLSGSTIGIIGYGHIGRYLGAVAAAIGMQVLVTDPHVTIDKGGIPRQVGLDELLANADFVVPLAVATPETANLIDATALAKMKPSAFLINVSRGELVDEAALERALDRHVIAGAALDVGRAAFQMPPPHLASRGDVIATPHVGGATPEAVRHQALETVRQVAAILAGEIPPGAVNADRATRLRR